VVSVFALNVKDASQVLGLLQGVGDEAVFKPVVMKPGWLGACSRPLRVGVPAEVDCDVGLGFASAFMDAVGRLHRMQVEVVPVDMGPLHEIAQLLYDGPWVAERYSVVKSLIDAQPQAMDPTVRNVIAQASQFDATQTFEARYRLATLARQAEAVWTSVDVLMVPTTPTCPTFEALAKQPVALNSALGRYTNFVNLLGWSALALPSSMSRSGLPFGVTFIAPEGADAALADWGLRWEDSTPLSPGAGLPPSRRAPAASAPRLAAEPTLKLAVVGAHLKGLPLHPQLVERHCRWVSTTRTAPCYRLFALAGTKPAKPGMVRAAEGGAAIEVEVYDMPLSGVGSFLQAIPFPLGLGNVELADGSWVKGFVCDPAGLDGALDITAHGGWRAYLAQEAQGREHA
jgi:allophanate hydrolase